MEADIAKLPAWRRHAAATGERRSCAMLLLGILLGATALGILTTIVVIVQGN